MSDSFGDWGLRIADCGLRNKPLDFQCRNPKSEIRIRLLCLLIHADKMQKNFCPGTYVVFLPMHLSGKRLLVIGGAGLIGSPMVGQLVETDAAEISFHHRMTDNGKVRFTRAKKSLYTAK